ncbi:type IX secretion system membrane protein PorP/SprF, partial [Hyunsoonleella flava]
MKHVYILVILFIVFLKGLNAQQDPQYTQYMYNQAIINPAYAGSKEYLQITTLYRNQWTGFP